MKPTVSDTDFVKAWQKSDRVDEVAAKVGLTRVGTYARARRLRMRGVLLKKFQYRSEQATTDVLNKLIQELNGI